MIEEQKEREAIIAIFEEIVQKSTPLWHHYKATLSANASEKIELVVSKK